MSTAEIKLTVLKVSFPITYSVTFCVNVPSSEITNFLQLTLQGVNTWNCVADHDVLTLQGVNTRNCVADHDVLTLQGVNTRNCVADHDVSMTVSAQFAVSQWHVMPTAMPQINSQWRLTEYLQCVAGVCHQSVPTHIKPHCTSQWWSQVPHC